MGGTSGGCRSERDQHFWGSLRFVGGRVGGEHCTVSQMCPVPDVDIPQELA